MRCPNCNEEMRVVSYNEHDSYDWELFCDHCHTTVYGDGHTETPPED